MKVSKWVDMGQEVEIEIGLDDVRAALAECFAKITRDTLGESMPVKWQRSLIRLMDELDDTIDWGREGLEIRLRDEHGRYIHDELVDYERGRRRIPWRKEGKP